MALQSLLLLQPKIQSHYSNMFSSIDQMRTIASFPDSQRDVPLKSVYETYKVAVPKSLAAYALATTTDWHFHNNTLLDDTNRKCEFENKGKLLDVIKALDNALKEDLNEKQSAITLSFFIHLLQDLHQPLHTFTKLDNKCKHDRGGNLVCLSPSKKSGKACEQNLHQLWDAGFSVFDGGVALPQAKVKNYKFSPDAWAYESTRYYKSVYDFKEKNYAATSQKIAAKQVSAAIARLAGHLKQHYALYNKKTPLLIKKPANAKK